MGEDKATTMVGSGRRITINKREVKKAAFNMDAIVHCLVNEEGEI